jgi:hypothetical protein
MEDNASASPCRYIALDIHKYYSVVAGVDREGKEILSACRVEHVDLENWSIKHLLPTDRVVTLAPALQVQVSSQPRTLGTCMTCWSR